VSIPYLETRFLTREVEEEETYVCVV